jgi:starvation-inducible outer membrane lipoprotein
MRNSIRIFAFASTSVLCACATTPPQLRGDFADITPMQAATNRFADSHVRWGGIIVGSRGTDAGACLEIAAFPLQPVTMQPIDSASIILRHSAGIPRFLACGTPTADRNTYYNGREVSLTGAIASAYTYEVESADCNSRHRPSVAETEANADYSGSARVRLGDKCFISLPTLNVETAYAWTRGPRSFDASRPGDGGPILAPPAVPTAR